MKKNKIVTFGLLGLGAVVKVRVFKLFKNELINSKVIGVFDKDKKNLKNILINLNVIIIKTKKNFLIKNLIFVTFQHHREVILKIF